MEEWLNRLLAMLMAVLSIYKKVNCFDERDISHRLEFDEPTLFSQQGMYQYLCMGVNHLPKGTKGTLSQLDDAISAPFASTVINDIEV